MLSRTIYHVLCNFQKHSSRQLQLTITMWQTKGFVLVALFTASTFGKSLNDSCNEIECPPMSSCKNGICACMRGYAWRDPLKKENCVYRPGTPTEIRNDLSTTTTRATETVASSANLTTMQMSGLTTIDLTTEVTTNFTDTTAFSSTDSSPTKTKLCIPCILGGLGGLIVLVVVAIIVYCVYRQKKRINFKILP